MNYKRNKKEGTRIQGFSNMTVLLFVFLFLNTSRNTDFVSNIRYKSFTNLRKLLKSIFRCHQTKFVMLSWCICVCFGGFTKEGFVFIYWNLSFFTNHPLFSRFCGPNNNKFTNKINSDIPIINLLLLATFSSTIQPS